MSDDRDCSECEGTGECQDCCSYDEDCDSCQGDRLCCCCSGSGMDPESDPEPDGDFAEEEG